LTTIRATSYGLAALVLIAVGLGVRQRFFSRVGPTLTQNADHHQTGPTVAIAPGRELSGAPSQGASNETSTAIAHRARADPAKLAMTADSQDKAGPLLGQSETSDSVAVVGRAFPVSAAVEDDCKRRRDYICDDVHEKLAKMALEPRDTRWAAEMEALIQQDVLSEEEPGRFRIRDIECRTSLCAAEVESTFGMNGTYGSYMGGMQIHHDALNAALHTNFNTFAYEIDSSGARVTVTVITFTKR
jgi:hypothetical protein